MATSSIFADFDIREPEKAAAFVDALEASYQDSLKHTEQPDLNGVLLTGAKEIDNFFDKGGTAKRAV